MSTTLNRPAYERLISEDIKWLLEQPRTLERDHIESVLMHSAEALYGRRVDAAAPLSALDVFENWRAYLRNVDHDGFKAQLLALAAGSEQDRVLLDAARALIWYAFAASFMGERAFDHLVDQRDHMMRWLMLSRAVTINFDKARADLDALLQAYLAQNPPKP